MYIIYNFKDDNIGEIDCMSSVLKLSGLLND